MDRGCVVGRTDGTAIQKQLASVTNLDHLEHVQSLLLMVFAATNVNIRAYGQISARWLQVATAILRETRLAPAAQHLDLSIQARPRLWRRLWWCGFLMEQLHFLRYSLEATRPLHSPSFVLDPSTAEPLLLEDFDLNPAASLESQIPGYWTRMQKASCFRQKMALCKRMAQIVLERHPKAPPGRKRRRKSSQNRIHHDEYFWRVESIAQEFAQRQCDTQVQGLREMLDEERDLTVVATRVSVELLVTRIIIALHRVPNKRRNKDGSGLNWDRIRNERIVHAIRGILATSRKFLGRCEGDHREPSIGAEAALLRTMIVASTALLSLDGPESRPPDYGNLRRDCRMLLQACLVAIDILWTGAGTGTGAGTAIDCPSSPQSPPHLTSATTREATPSDLTPTPEAPEIWRGYSLATAASLDLVEQKLLLRKFDDMWNGYLKIERVADN